MTFFSLPLSFCFFLLRLLLHPPLSFLLPLLLRFFLPPQFSLISTSSFPLPFHVIHRTFPLLPMNLFCFFLALPHLPYLILLFFYDTPLLPILFRLVNLLNV